MPFKYIKAIELESAKKEGGDDTMQISDFLNENNIILDINSSDKSESIKEIANTLKGSAEILDYDKFLEDIFEREALIIGEDWRN